MKIQIEQRSVYHKIAVVEIEVDADEYEHFKLDNGKFTGMDDYLLENENLWAEQIDEKMAQADYEFGMGCDADANKHYKTNFDMRDAESEYRWEWKEKQQGGHL